MAFNIVKGWVPKSISAGDILYWTRFGTNYFDTLTEEGVISKYKGKKADWQEDEWPPKRVTITVVID